MTSNFWIVSLDRHLINLQRSNLFPESWQLQIYIAFFPEQRCQCMLTGIGCEKVIGIQKFHFQNFERVFIRFALVSLWLISDKQQHGVHLFTKSSWKQTASPVQNLNSTYRFVLFTAIN